MKFLEKIWTSDLSITGTENPVGDQALLEIKTVIDTIEELFPSKHGRYVDRGKSVMRLCETVVKTDGSGLLSYVDLLEFVNYTSPQDFTGLMKGLAIQAISDVLLKGGEKSFTISFGSDVMTVNRPVTLVSKYNPKFKIELGNGCAFTSGNDVMERGNHVKVYEENPYVVIHLIDDTGFRPVFCDFAATHIYSKLSLVKKWPFLKVIGMRADGRAELLCDGIVSKEEGIVSSDETKNDTETEEVKDA